MLKNKKAQSLAELGIFASLILLAFAVLISWGLKSNYQQEIRMRAFRKGLHLAVANARSAAIKPQVLIKDKRIPDPQEITISGSAIPIEASGSAIWSDYLYRSSLKIPSVTYNINGKEYVYTIADKQELEIPSQNCVLRRKRLINPYPNNPNRHWDWEYLGCLDEDVRPGVIFDVNRDIFEEPLVIVGYILDQEDAREKIYLQYIDYAAGDINLLIDPPNDQGLLPSFTQTTEKDFSLEGSVGGATETGKVKEKFVRRIRTRYGTCLIIPDANPQDFSLSLSWEQ